MTNNEAVGYAVGALYNMLDGDHQHKKEKCQKLAHEMYWLFDMKTEDEAYQIRKAVLHGENTKEIRERL